MFRRFNVENRLSVFVSSPDKHSDVFEVFLSCFKRFWNDCPYEIILSTNTSTCDGIKAYRNYQVGDSWIERTLSVLKVLRTKYVLLMCDDLCVCEKPNLAEIEKILDTMDMYGIKCCRLEPIKKSIPVRGNKDLVWVYKKMPYALNLCMGIYDREYLIKQLGDGNASAEELEKKWLLAALKAKDEYFEDIVACKKQVIKVIHCIAEGKWIKNSIKKLQKMGIEAKTEREIMKQKDEMIFILKSVVGRKFLSKDSTYLVDIFEK